MNQRNEPEESIWHAGERHLQQSVGVAQQMEEFGRRVVRDHMPDQHRLFYSQLPYLVLGAVDEHGTPWATLIEGPPGFIHSPSPRVLELNQLPAQGDPVREALIPGAGVALLGIDLKTRRRNRMNGHLSAVTADGFSVFVEHAFGNCPQYIQLRSVDPVRPGRPSLGSEPEHLTDLDEAASAFITQSDTFFVASYLDRDGDASKRSVDVSHRGGKPGFVKVRGNVLTIPDFAGNLHFNTLGNFLLNPRAGLLFIDFQTGDVLHVVGHVTVILEGPEIPAFQGAERLWTLTVDRVVRRAAVLSLRWHFDGFSPNSLMTGNWEQAAGRLQADALRNEWRQFRVTRLVDESSTIRSFYLEPADSAGLPRFEAGQHLPVRVCTAEGNTPVVRTYSLSSAPSDSFFRISVKRDGVISSHLHDRIQVGDVIDARAPQGRFTIQPDEHRPLVLIAAGVGVTPMLSMLREVIYQGERIRRTRPTWFIQSARSLAELGFRDELYELATRAKDNVRALRLLSQPEKHAREGKDFELAGRVDLELLKALLPLDDYDFYLCGPGAFTQALYDGLRDLRIGDDRIHAETFGPSTLIRQRDHLTPAVEQVPAATNPVRVLFSASAKEARWEPGGGSLLELAESRGLSPDFSCRGGSCGTCRTRLVSGQVHYSNLPAEMPAGGEVLICCAVPAHPNEGDAPLVLDL
ncbi:pyridoxamine 5'-phosphate oxidase family protein [Pseudomonas petrae]|uniref:Pyridoxamine 5'-phosphate oxidase family protein n=1 Tax=Pseudomonas petrae TaxID=2912190 RepID=A0ABS9IAI5_9PSED|nr:pyridoxamine 5'-phosphate oxidase family protein [Pseudomonas petrae]MCF7530964.1 pyridoxamine 5'-phosphate oxidase family protein [Pseudomonas petrae]MCF7536638.1 pyridoxamine 5'-phosphate oxidase family protein [Pseudomonas petrae]MCF7544249.1 pyridoxamine 5'-phosphate oxidase family protein [Pseudomonas petrae]MCF7554318.1 pyridoxamine 5'-phosphate oxidase family protein [Pseudomonas petrae]